MTTPAPLITVACLRGTTSTPRRKTVTTGPLMRWPSRHRKSSNRAVFITIVELLCVLIICILTISILL